MRTAHFFQVLALALLCAAPSLAAKTLKFSGYTWDVRADGAGGQGPNHWSQKNAWVDDAGRLHLLLSPRGGAWPCAEKIRLRSFQFTPR